MWGLGSPLLSDSLNVRAVAQPALWTWCLEERYNNHTPHTPHTPHTHTTSPTPTHTAHTAHTAPPSPSPSPLHPHPSPPHTHTLHTPHHTHLTHHTYTSHTPHTHTTPTCRSQRLRGLPPAHSSLSSGEKRRKRKRRRKNKLLRSARVSGCRLRSTTSGLLGSSVETCSHVSLATSGIFFDFPRACGPRISGRFSCPHCSSGNLDTVRAPRSWQLVVRCLGRLWSTGLWRDDFGILFSYSALLALFDSGYMYMRQSGWSPEYLRDVCLDMIATCSSYPAVTYLVPVSPEEYRKLDFWEFTFGHDFYSRLVIIFTCPWYLQSLSCLSPEEYGIWRGLGDDFRNVSSRFAPCLATVDAVHASVCERFDDVHTFSTRRFTSDPGVGV